MKLKLFLLLAILALTGCSGVKAADTKTETPAVYVICDVIKNYDEIVDGELYHALEVIMPNGEIHKYGIQDPPEGKIEIVCFKTENQDDYSVYEVVSAR